MGKISLGNYDLEASNLIIRIFGSLKIERKYVTEKHKFWASKVGILPNTIQLNKNLIV